MILKKVLITLICITLVLVTSFNSNKISSYIASKISANPKLIIENKNAYAKNEGFAFVQTTENYTPYSYHDLLNIIYSVINNGWTSFTFYCPSEYKNCISDIEKISQDDLTLTHINNFVHPFNSFTNLNTMYLESGEVTFKINYLYSKKEIEAINKEVDKIIANNIDANNTDYENIKILHDYIINNTKYDVERNEKGTSDYESYSAYGLLFDHFATCNGYTDTMAIMLSKLNLKNYKIATTPDQISYDSTGHIWNAVYLDGKWLHLDLTWDDPVSDSGENYLYHKYFLVNNEELNKADTGNVVIEEHNFNPSIYLEFNESIKDIIS